MLKQVPIEKLHRYKDQPRRNFDEAALKELAESIKSVGILEPIIVRPSKIRHEEYEIAAGERRWRAAQLAGLSDVLVIVKTISDDVMDLIAIVENVQREPLNAIEEARAYQKLIHDHQYLQAEIASAIGKSESHISHLLNILTLEQRVQQFLEQDQLKLGHGKALASLPKDQQFNVAQLAVKNAWSVRKLEQYVRNLKAATPKKKSMDDPSVTRLQERFSEHLAAPISIKHNSKTNAGKIVISYSSLDELDSILQRSGFHHSEDEY